jgi:DNA-binding transcriptional regulator PaaX
MGKLEEKNKKRRKKENLQKIILGTIATTGVLSMALVAPNVIGAMGKLGMLTKSRRTDTISSSTSKLTKKGFLKFEKGFYQVTKKGEKALRLWELSDFKLKKPKRWDKKWRIIIYDIPEKKVRSRKQISKMFKQANFYRLQNSVWVYPYDCEDIIGILKTDFSIGKEVLYIIADEIENDGKIRKYFNLKL